MGEKSGVVGKVVHYYWIIESAKKWIMECVNEQKQLKECCIYAISEAFQKRFDNKMITL